MQDKPSFIISSPEVRVVEASAGIWKDLRFGQEICATFIHFAL